MWLADMFTGRKQDRFAQLFDSQTATLVKAASELERYVAEEKPEISDEIDSLEKQGDAILNTIFNSLTDTFITPFDRQDIFNLAETIDDMIDYINNAAREIKLFGVSATPALKEMVHILAQGASEVRQTVMLVETDPAAASRHAAAASNTENAMEDLYRRTLAQLFDSSDIATVFKLREIYRHLSNSADRADLAGKQVGKVVVKVT